MPSFDTWEDEFTAMEDEELFRDECERGMRPAPVVHVALERHMTHEGHTKEPGASGKAWSKAFIRVLARRRRRHESLFDGTFEEGERGD